MKELCFKCQEKGFCEFEKKAKEIARMANSKEVNPSHAINEIANLRHFAREERLCPNINRVNPQIKGL
ncbi:MAG: hypothetical protein V1697_02415 [Candidatus Levyibacteriota bacterium]